jgi:hypothetical protein
MSALVQRHYDTARSGNAGSSGMRMALDCARNVYEAVDRRMPEAAALANWLAQNAAAFGLPERRSSAGRSRTADAHVQEAASKKFHAASPRPGPTPAAYPSAREA